MDSLAALSSFARIALAIFLEAMPFLTLGALISGMMEAYVGHGGLERLAPKGRALQLGLGLVAGMALPTCECGTVPLGRRLLVKGAPPTVAITYMLSAPVVNPLVLASTYVAFGGDWKMTAARALTVIIPAAFLGYFLGKTPTIGLLRPGSLPQPVLQNAAELGAAPALDDQCGPACGCGHDHGQVAGQSGPRWLNGLRHAAVEFLEMGKYLVLGCLVAAAFKVYAPWDMVMGWTENVFLATASLMLLAILLSVCSEADAFVAASFLSFPDAAQLGFLAIGPMVDLKLIGMYFGVFRKPAALGMILVPIILIYPLSLLIGAWL